MQLICFDNLVSKILPSLPLNAISGDSLSPLANIHKIIEILLSHPKDFIFTFLSLFWQQFYSYIFQKNFNFIHVSN